MYKLSFPETSFKYLYTRVLPHITHISKKKQKHTQVRMNFLLMTDSGAFRDVAHHRAHGAGRDCFMLADSPLSLKLYFETSWRSNANEYHMLPMYYHQLPEHLPCPVGQQIQQIRGQNGMLIDTDMLLVENVGETLENRLKGLVIAKVPDEEVDRRVAQWLCELVDMSYAAFQKRIPWYIDLHIDTVTWNPRTNRWYLIDLDVDRGTLMYDSFERCWTHAAKELKCGIEKYGRGGQTFTPNGCKRVQASTHQIATYLASNVKTSGGQVSNHAAQSMEPSVGNKWERSVKHAVESAQSGRQVWERSGRQV